MARLVATRPLSEWLAMFEGSDACVGPANTLQEAWTDPHLAARQTFVEAFGVVQPAPAPRFGRTPGAIAGPPPAVGEHDQELLRPEGDG
jgi:alpha-methylacyl-CoA racemase